MKTTGMGKRILIFTLIAVIVLTMQGPRVFAGSLQPENRSETSAEQAANQPETAEGQPENQLETIEGQSGSQNDLPEEEQKIQPEITGEESVSQNDLPEEEQENQSETTREESVSGNDLSVLQSVNLPAVAAEQTDADAYPKLTDAVLKKCIVPGMNPPGVTVNLFDYWQSGGPSPDMEISHDQTWPDAGIQFLTYKMGISEGHLLRFGYKCVDCEDCDAPGEVGFGAWNNSITGRPCQGIVKNKLENFGFPSLNLSTKTDDEFGGYAKLDAVERKNYLSPEKKEESLSYLFSTDDRSDSARDYRAKYIDVRGLFQPDEDGYYYYNSAENFVSYNKATNSFVLYNSPGVANEQSCGQFFPFNKAEDVFDTYTVDNGNYRLCYVDKKNVSNGKPDSYDYPILIDDISYLQCTANRLNHYLGMTLEFLFQQPENGCMPNGKEMTFEFTGDDDVWIFIDNVLVADLGGIHGACSLDINFSTGVVNVEGNQHTLLKSFQDAYGADSDLGGIAFRDDMPTFADNTDHTFKMFYLERGHTASDLDLKFNVLPIPDEPVKKDPPDKDPDENETPPGEDSAEDEESAPDPALESNISLSDDRMVLDTTGIPRTGDDSRIGWLIALCIISLSGIGAAVYNLTFIRRKEKKHSSKE